MDWGHLFFKFSGRINRAKFWIAALVYAVISIIFAVLSYVTDQSGAVQAVGGIVNLVVFISSLAVGVKRLHDREKSGWYLVLFYIVPSVLVGAAAVMGMTMEDSTMIAGILGLIAFAIGVWAFVELGCLRGTAGPNRFGPDPIGAIGGMPPPVRTAA
jgi:uncharacterized membrane protein YhaH (DUF805 family)